MAHIRKNTVFGSFRVVIRGIGAALIVLVAVTGGAGEKASGTCVEVIDGDTVVVEIAGDRTEVNLAEVDAPELDQPFGQEAKDFMNGLVAGQAVKLEWLESGDSAWISVGDVNVVKELASAGLAWAGDTRDEQLVVAVVMARSSKRGLWQDESPVPPLTWRNRQPPEPTPTPADVARNLADAGRRVELKKNADGKTVIAGLPMIKPGADGEESEEEEGLSDGLRADFGCPSGGVTGCVQKEFSARFGQAYPDDGPGTFTANQMDQGDGTLTIMFQGISVKNRAYAVGAACHCPPDVDQCQCVMQFGSLTEAASEESEEN